MLQGYLDQKKPDSGTRAPLRPGVGWASGASGKNEDEGDVLTALQICGGRKEAPLR